MATVRRKVVADRSRTDAGFEGRQRIKVCWVERRGPVRWKPQLLGISCAICPVFSVSFFFKNHSPHAVFVRRQSAGSIVQAVRLKIPVLVVEEEVVHDWLVVGQRMQEPRQSGKQGEKGENDTESVKEEGAPARQMNIDDVRFLRGEV